MEEQPRAASKHQATGTLTLKCFHFQKEYDGKQLPILQISPVAC